MYLSLNSEDVQDFIKTNAKTRHAPYPEILTKCPICQDDRYKLYINTVSQVWCCHVCGYGTGKKDILELLSDISGQSYDEVAAQFGALTPSDTTTFLNTLNSALGEDESFEEDVLLYTNEESRLPRSFKISKNSEVSKYLTSRGISPKLIRKYGIYTAHYIYGFCDEFVLFRFFDFFGNIAFQGRRVSEREPKYVSSKNTANALYPVIDENIKLGLDNKRVWLVEGVFDAIGLIESGECAFACFGNKLSRSQIEFLKNRFGKDCEYVFGFDSDKQTRAKVEYLAKELSLEFLNISVADTSYRLDDSSEKKIDFGDYLKNPDELESWKDAVIANRKPLFSGDYVAWQAETRM